MSLSFEMSEVSDLLREDAEKIVLPHWRTLTPDQIRQKTNPSDLVTVADLESEKFLTAALRKLLPGSSVLGEEAYAADPSIVRALDGDAPVWIVDPIDGTLHFSNMHPGFGIIVSLCQKGEILRGWIYHPVTKGLMVAERGSGAFFNGERLGFPEAVPFEKQIGLLDFSERDAALRLEKLPNSPCFTSTGYMSCGGTLRILTEQSLFTDKPEPRAHFRLAPKHSAPWDDAANVLAVRECGGEVTNWQGKVYHPAMYKEGIIAARSLDECHRLRAWAAPALASS